MEQSNSYYKDLKSSQKKTYFEPWTGMATIAFYGYLIANKEETCKVLGINSTLILFITFMLLFLTKGLGMSVSATLFRKYTGLSFVKDRQQFAIMGGYDAGRIPMIFSQASVFGIYWWTFQKITPDPIIFLRNPWLFLLLTIVIGFTLTYLIVNLTFKYQS